MTFKQAVDKEIRNLFANLGFTDTELCKMKQDYADRILAAHNARLDEIAEGMESVSDYTQLSADQDYVRSQKEV